MSEIQLISDITVRPVQSMGGDAMVVAAAKVSTTGEEALKFADPSCEESNAGLINFLMSHRHGTPFEHAAMTFFVHAPILVWREWHRHRIGFSYNEESARYKPLDPVFWIPRRHRPMVPVEGWKPGNPKFLTLDRARFAMLGDTGRVTAEADSWYGRVISRKRSAYQATYDAYQGDIDDGIALEVARSVLPVGIYSSCWVTCNPRSLMSFLSLRVNSEESKFISYPQAEIQEAAEIAERFLAEGWPITHRTFVRNGRVAP